MRDRGVGLIEVLVSIVILGTVAVVVLAGLTTTIVSADRHRDLSTGSTVLVDGLELAKSRPFETCAAAVAAYDPPDVTRGGLTWTYTITVVSSNNGTYGGACVDSDSLQLVTVRVDAVGADASLTGHVVKRDD